jgi:integrase
MKNPSGIKKLANGKYQARYFAGRDSKGKRQYPSQTFALQAEAIKWLNQKQGAKATGDGRVIESTDLTVTEYFKQYLTIKQSQVRANTIQTYQGYFDNYIAPGIGQIKLSRLRPLHLATLQSDLVQRVSGTTARLTQVILLGALKQAIALQLLTVNPLEGLALPKKSKRKLHALTVEEALAYLDACQTQTYGLALEFALATGLRPEEYQGLKWSDIGLTDDKAQGVVKVRQVVQAKTGGGWRWEEPKSAKGKRPVCFSFELYQQLQEHRRRQLEKRLACGGAWNEEDLVFCSSTGRPIQRRILFKNHRAALTAAKLPATVRLYDLRHAFVTFSLVAGVDVKTVSAEAGHASVAFTMDTYGHVLQEQYEKAGEQRAALFAGRRRRAK